MQSLPFSQSMKRPFQPLFTPWALGREFRKVKRGLVWTIFKMGSELKHDDIRTAGHSEKKNQNGNLDNQKLFFRIN